MEELGFFGEFWRKIKKILEKEKSFENKVESYKENIDEQKRATIGSQTCGKILFQIPENPLLPIKRFLATSLNPDI